MTSACLILSLMAAAAQSKGRLRDFEEPFRSSRESNSGDSSRRQEHEPYQDYRPDDGFRDSVRVPSGDPLSFSEVLFYPCIDHGLRYDDFPYASPRPSRYFLTERHSARDWSADVQLYTIRVEHDLSALGLTGTLRYGSGSTFRLDLVEYFEKVEGSTDRLMLQTYEVNYGPGRGLRTYQWTFGIGGAVLDGQQTHAGVSLQGAVDWFPVAPVSLRLHAAWLIFSESTLADFQAEVNLHWNRFALGLGVRSLINSEDHLTGPLASVTVWF